MQAASLAERLLRLALGRERASAAVGDLVEISRGKGKSWFWVSLFGCLVRSAWRPIAGGVILMYVTNWTLNIFTMASVSIYTKHLPTVSWWPCLNGLCAFGALMCGAGIYSAICFGFSDKFTQFATVFSGLCSAVIYAWWLPGVLPSAIVISLVSLIFFFSRSEGRWAILTALVTATASILTFLLLTFADSLYENHLMHGKPMGDADLRQHPVLLWLGFLIFLINAAATAATCSRMHAIFVRRSMGALPSEAID